MLFDLFEPLSRLIKWHQTHNNAQASRAGSDTDQ